MPNLASIKRLKKFEKPEKSISKEFLLKQNKKVKKNYILKFIEKINKSFWSQPKQRLLSYGIMLIFVVLLSHLANLQLFVSQKLTTQNLNNAKALEQLVKKPVNYTVTNSLRGQIYVTDRARNQSQIPLTSTQLLARISIDPLELSKLVKTNTLTIESVSTNLASNLNISYPKILDIIKAELSKENLSRYSVIENFGSEQQRQTANFLISDNKNNNKYYTWLRVDDVTKRTYPQNQLAASVVGYMSKYPTPQNEALESECRKIVQKDIDNGINISEYNTGYYGLEQKYCEILNGSNGKKMLGGDNKLGEGDVLEINGSNFYLTIDYTLQQKAESLLQKAVKDNTNENGPPKDGTITIINPKSGKILAMASYPSFDPNNYNDTKDPRSYRNVGSSVDYEVGSSMKPLTVAMALTEYDYGTKGSNGQTIGIPSNWSKKDYGPEGKIYIDAGGNKDIIHNSQNKSYDDRDNDLKLVIRDSLNTMISDITDSVGNVKIKDYLENKFLFSQKTQATFAGGGSGNLSSLESNIQCQFCYAQHGFGQGFYVSPLQLLRAYTALANNGKMTEPYLVEKIINPDGTEDTGKLVQSPIYRNEPKQIFTEKASKLTTEYMKSVIEEGYLGSNPRGIEGYTIAAKTGTAQISRPIINPETKKEEPCYYVCNTDKGLFDHTLIGYGPTQSAEVMILVKLSEPRPGVVQNFADTTLMPTFLEMMKYTLEYYQIPRDK